MTQAKARIWFDKDELRIRFLDEKWTWKQIHESKFTLSYVEAPAALVVRATTEELRKFVAEHSDDDDKEAFFAEFRLISDEIVPHHSLTCLSVPGKLAYRTQYKGRPSWSRV